MAVMTADFKVPQLSDMEKLLKMEGDLEKAKSAVVSATEKGESGMKEIFAYTKQQKAFENASSVMTKIRKALKDAAKAMLQAA